MSAAAAPYPITLVQRVRELREAGWTMRRICELVEGETGRRPSLHTISMWTDPEKRDRHLQRTLDRHRRHSASGGRAGGRLATRANLTSEFRLARMRALDDLGMSAGGIATVMNFDFGSDLTEDQVRYALRVGRYPKRRPMAARAAS